MVCTDNGLPEPDSPTANLRVSSVGLITDTDDDSDPELPINGYDLYQPLSSTPLEDSEGTSDEDPDSPDSNASSSLPPIVPIEEEIVQELWSGLAREHCNIELDSNQIDEVIKAMIDITLPPESFPDWAADISEEEWKQKLCKLVEDMQEKKT